MKLVEISTFITRWPLLGLVPPTAWLVSQDCENQVLALLAGLGEGYRRHGDCAIHESAVVEQGAVLKGPIIIGEGSFVEAGAHLREAFTSAAIASWAQAAK